MTSKSVLSSQVLSDSDKTDLTLGQLGIELADGVVRKIKWHGVELLRGISYPIRDVDWGTLPCEDCFSEISIDGESAKLHRSFCTRNGGFAGDFSLKANSSGEAKLELNLVALNDQTVSRAGFILLHPIVELAGKPLTIMSDNGTQLPTYFPLQISPTQPARDIEGMKYTIDGCSISIKMAGDIFEMEDQRNWSDASYKTYCRPLALPFPYMVKKGETIQQRISLSVNGNPKHQNGANVPNSLFIPEKISSETIPVTQLAFEPNWHGEISEKIEGIAKVHRYDLRSEQLDPAMINNSVFSLELVTSDGLEQARQQLAIFAQTLEDADLTPSHVIALPAAYLKSYQPDGEWPTGATPSDLVMLARSTFPNAKIGGGMLTNFTELNRHRPDISSIDYVSHGTSAIVHAADDESVFQTIETLPQIFSSMRALAPETPYRLGLVSIGMRTNPYGEGLATNPEGMPRTMIDADPRHGSMFAAAWVVAAMSATNGFDIETVTLGAEKGPFGIVRDTTEPLIPCFHAINGLNSMAGMRRLEAEIADPSLYVVAGEANNTAHLIIANGSASVRNCIIPAKSRGALLDAKNQKSAASDQNWVQNNSTDLNGELRLLPYAIAFLSLPLNIATSK